MFEVTEANNQTDSSALAEAQRARLAKSYCDDAMTIPHHWDLGNQVGSEVIALCKKCGQTKEMKIVAQSYWGWDTRAGPDVIRGITDKLVQNNS